MKMSLDRISEAYYNKVGNEFGELVRERIHWICSYSKGESILDIGCSQGIADILLAREGKKIFAIDINSEAIEHANSLLEGETEQVKKYVDFQCENFMTYSFNDTKFDSLIMAEILEHITDPVRFLNKAKSLLVEEGCIIITVPFGINDYFDHKKTYYAKEILELINLNFTIGQVKFFGEWIGIIAYNNKEIQKYAFDENLIGEMENAFYYKEKALLNKGYNINTKYENVYKKYEKESLNSVNSKKENEQLKELNLKLISEVKENIEKYRIDKEKLIEININSKKEYNESVNVFEREKRELRNKEIELVDELELKDKIITELKKDTDNYIKENKELRGLNIELNKEINKEINENLYMLKKENEELRVLNIDLNKELNENINMLKKENQELRKKNIELVKELEVREDKENRANIEDVVKQVTNLNLKILNNLNIERKELVSYLSLLKESEGLRKENLDIQKKYEVLKNSKLATLTLKYWVFRKKYLKRK